VNRSSAALVSLLALFACGGETPAGNSNTGGQGGTSGSTGGTPAAIGGCTSAECGPSTDDFFDNSKVAAVKLTFDAEDLKGYTDVDHPRGYAPDEWLDLLWSLWNNHCGPYTWVPARMEYVSPDGNGDVVLERVAVRLRGSKSRGTNPLAGMKVDFTKSLPEDTNRRFAGLSRFNALSNEAVKIGHYQSKMLQSMSYKLIRDFGVEAPMCNQVQVFVNGELYGMVESVERGKDARFLKHHFGTSDGPLYSASATCGFTDSLADLQYYGDSFDTDKYTKAYDILRGTPVDAEANLIPMLKCGDPTQTPDDEAFKTCISEWIDVDQWLRLIAGESLMPTVEDFVGAKRNYYLYFQPDATAPHGGKMRVWGWDYDTSMQVQACLPSNCDPFTGVAGWYAGGRRAKLVTRLTTVFKAEYCELLNTFLTDVYDPTKVDDMASVLDSYMMNDPVVSHEDWQKEVVNMREFMVQHTADMHVLIDKACN
jgi:spore coat protein CotH